MVKTKKPHQKNKMNKKFFKTKHLGPFSTILSNANRRYSVIIFSILLAVIASYFLVISRADTTYGLYKYPLVTQYDNDYPPALITNQKLMERGSVSGYMYAHTFAGYSLPEYIHFHDSSSGKTSNVGLPGFYGRGVTVWARDNTVWILTASTNIKIYHYALDNSTLPTTATLLSTDTFGDSDSRMHDIIQLESGAIVATYAQQSGAGSTTMLYRSASSQSWQTIQTSALYTSSSKSRLVQHPADKTVWLFCDPDAWGAIEAAHFTETTNGLQLDWTETKFISAYSETDVAPDPENPDLIAAADPSTGEIVLAYQSAQRKMWFKTDPPSGYVYGKDFINVSYPAVARVKPDKSKTFVTLPIYVERVSQLGMIVRPGEVWLAYRPVDPNTYAFNQAYSSLYRNGVWETPVYLGQLHQNSDTNFTQSWAPILSGVSRPEFVLPLTTSTNTQIEGKINFISMLAAGSIDSTPPTSTITSPVNGATISGNFNVVATSTDNVAVTRLELYMNNSLLASTAASNLSFNIDTTKYANGSYALVTRAYDGAGNSTSSSTVSVQISNMTAPPPTSTDTTSPSATITSPLNNSSVKGVVSVSGFASDNIGVTKTELWIDGKLANTSSSSSLSYSWDTKRIKRGSHTIMLRAYDAAGNSGTTQVIVTK